MRKLNCNVDECQDDSENEEAGNAEAVRRAKLFPNTIQKQKCCPQILVVDDYEFNIHALTLMLKSYKLKCDCAVNGRQALDKILREKDCDCQYSLILLDCNMPVMNGYATCGEIRQLIRDKVVPAINILAVTADATKMNQERCLNCGFDNVVEKPIFAKPLEKMLFNYLVEHPNKI